MNIFVITKIVVENNKKEIKTDYNFIKKSPSTEIGNWKTSDDELFVFQDNKNFYYYTSLKNKDDNYYAGSYNYKNGKEALKEMGYTEEEFYKTFSKDANIEKLYSLTLVPKIVLQNGKDIKNIKLSENESWWYILIIKDDDTAIAYNKTLDLRYNLKKE